MRRAGWIGAKVLEGIERDFQQWLGDGIKQCTLSEYEGFLLLVVTLVVIERADARAEGRRPTATGDLLNHIYGPRPALEAVRDATRRHLAMA